MMDNPVMNPTPSNQQSELETYMRDIDIDHAVSQQITRIVESHVAQQVKEAQLKVANTAIACKEEGWGSEREYLEWVIDSAASQPPSPQGEK